MASGSAEREALCRYVKVPRSWKPIHDQPTSFYLQYRIYVLFCQMVHRGLQGRYGFLIDTGNRS